MTELNSQCYLHFNAQRRLLDISWSLAAEATTTSPGYECIPVWPLTLIIQRPYLHTTIIFQARRENCKHRNSRCKRKLDVYIVRLHTCALFFRTRSWQIDGFATFNVPLKEGAQKVRDHRNLHNNHTRQVNLNGEKELPSSEDLR